MPCLCVVNMSSGTQIVENSYGEEDLQGWRYVESPLGSERHRKAVRDPELRSSRLKYFDMEATNHLIAQASTEVVTGVERKDSSSNSSSVFANRLNNNSRTPPMAIHKSVIISEDIMGGDDMMIEKFIQSRSEMHQDDAQADDDESVDSYVTDEEQEEFQMQSSSLINQNTSTDDYNEMEICFMDRNGAENELETPRYQRVGPLNPIPRKLLFLPILNVNQPSIFPQVGVETPNEGGGDTVSENEEDAMKTSIFLRRAAYPSRPKKHFDSDHDSEQTYTTGDGWSFSFDERESDSTNSGTLTSSGRTSIVQEAEPGVVVLDDGAAPFTPNRASTAFAGQQRGPVDIEISPVRPPVTSKSLNDVRKGGQAQRSDGAAVAGGVHVRSRRASPMFKGIVTSPVGYPSTTTTASRNTSARSTPDGHFRRINTRSSGAARVSGSTETRRRADDSTPLVGELEL